MSFYTLLVVLSIPTASWSGNIVYPWRSTTAIVKSGDSFDVWFNADAGQTVNSVELRGSYNTIACTKSVVMGDWEYDPLSKNRYNTLITVTVPSEAPTDRYDLVLRTSSGDVTSYGGVKVVRTFKDQYYIMHMSDGHIYQSGYDPITLLARKSTMIEMANIMDCQLIIETGDNMYNVRNHPEREEHYFLGIESEGIKGMAKATSATFLVPGDHDAYTANDWPQATVQENSNFFNDYWGLQNSSFRYGNGRFMLLNNAWDTSISSGKEHQYQTDNAVTWLKGAGAGGNFFLSAGHCYDKMHEFIDASQPLSLVLAGDKHHVRTDNPYPFNDGSASVAYIAGSIRDHFEFNLFQVNNITGTYTTLSGTNGVVEVLASGDQNDRTSWVSNLTLTYTHPNDGSTYENAATIINKFNFPISGARVRFIMPLGSMYAAFNGAIEQSFDGTSVHVVDVRLDLEANSTTVVNIAPSNVEDLCPDDPSKIAPGECGCGVPEGVCNPISVTAITVSPSMANLNVQASIQLTCTVEPSDATNPSVQWSSSNESIATVDSRGLVRAVGGGVVTITATSEDTGITSTSEITVIPDFLTLQAEDAVFSGPVVKTDQAGYNGTGFLDFVNSTNDYVTWRVNVGTTGTYSLSFRYALLSGSRPLQLSINGEIKVPSVDFPATGSWSSWGYYRTSQALNEGFNTVTLKAIGSSGGNFDELGVGVVGITTGQNLKSDKVSKSVVIYPNPCRQGRFSLGLLGFDYVKDVKLKIVDLMGQAVYSELLNSVDVTLDLNGILSESIYFVVIESKGFRIVKKLVVD